MMATEVAVMSDQDDKKRTLEKSRCGKIFTFFFEKFYIHAALLILLKMKVIFHFFAQL